MNGILNRITSRQQQQMASRHERAQELIILHRLLVPASGRLLYPGSGYGGILSNGLFQQFTCFGFDLEGEKCRSTSDLMLMAQADAAVMPYADDSFDVVFFDLVLHHLVTSNVLEQAICEGVRVLRPGGWLLAFEPNLWNPVGFGIEVARQFGVVSAIRGRDDDVPLSPRYVIRLLESRGCQANAYGVTFNWRRLPLPLQRLIIQTESLLLSSPLHILARTLLFVGHKLERVCRSSGAQ